MMKKERGEKIIIGALLVLLVVSVGFSINFYSRSQEVVEEKAQVFTAFTDWSGELGKQNGYIFTYWINNFGEVEAKDVVVECIVTDQNDNVIKRINKNFGNLASTSMEYDEMYVNIFEDTTDFSGYCITKSCSNCEILEEKIPDIAKYYE